MAASSSGYPRVNGVHPVPMTTTPSIITESTTWNLYATATIYAGYYDECNIEHMDSIKVIVEDEI